MMTATALTTKAPRFDVDSLRCAAIGQWRDIFARLGIDVPAHPKLHGPCPVCGGKDRFRFDDLDGKGTWYCNQCDPHAGDGFHLIQNVLQCDFPLAADHVTRVLGHSRPVGLVERKAVTSTNGSKPVRVVRDVPTGVLGTSLFSYTDATGQPVIYAQRIEHGGGGKHFCQWGPAPDGTGWQSNLDHAPKPRPLYRLPAILSDPSATVIVHEGEKAVEAACQAELPGLHTTSLAGAKSAHLSDFSAMSGRRVVICPDHDQDGERYGQCVRQLATEAGAASVSILHLPDLPLKGDVVEWLEAGGTAEAFSALLTTALEPSLPTLLPPAEIAAPPRITDAIVSYEDLLRFDMPERKEHLPWLKEGSLVMVFGPRGIGKTMLQLGLTAGLVTGTRFLAWSVTAPVGVLYIDGEMPLDELRSRTTSFLVEPPKAPLHFLTSEVVYHKTQRDLTLTSSEVQDEITAMLDAHPDIRVVILDNISSLFVGIDEDRKRDWEPISAWLVRLRHRGLSVILVHHAGKGGNQRGTSGREDALDVVIQLDRPSQYDAREGCHFELRFTKARSVKGDDVAPLDIRLSEAGGRVQLSYQALEESKLDEVRRLYEDGIISPSDMAVEANITKGYASKLIKKVKASAGVSA